MHARGQIDFELILYCSGTFKPAPGPTVRLMENKGQKVVREEADYLTCAIMSYFVALCSCVCIIHE